MLQRKNGATLAEIMDKMGWQKHTIRGVHGRRDEEGQITAASATLRRGRRRSQHGPNVAQRRPTLSARCTSDLSLRPKSNGHRPPSWALLQGPEAGLRSPALAGHIHGICYMHACACI